MTTLTLIILVALLAMCFLAKVIFTIYFRKYRYKPNENFKPIQASCIDGSPCLIIGDHPWAIRSGRVAGYHDQRGRWALIVRLDGEKEVFCCVYDNKNLLFL